MRRIAVIGGGVWVPRLCETLAAGWPEPVEMRVVARRAERLQTIVAHANGRVAHAGWRVTGTTDLGVGLQGADLVVLLVRVGGLPARAHDEAFPRLFGLPGDEGLGAGGVANTWRTITWVDTVAQQIRTSAPNAWVLNMMAPLGNTTCALLDAGLNAVGVCELPAVTLAALTGDQAHPCRFGGLNHLAWFWDIAERPGTHPLKYVSRVFGDQLPKAGRAETLRRLGDQLVADFAHSALTPAAESQRPTPWFNHALVPAIRALLGGVPWTHGYANTRNGDQITELPSQQVVELAARYDAAGIHPRAPGPLPTEVVPFVQVIARSDRFALKAARTRDRSAVVAAMAALPNVQPEWAEALATHAMKEVQP